MKRHAIAAVAALLFALPVRAIAAQDTPASASTVDPETLAAAERLMVAMDYDRMLQRTVDELAKQMQPMLKAAIARKIQGEVDDEMIRRLAGVIDKFLRRSVLESSDLRRAVAILYAKHLTRPELERLTILHREPAMKKWSEVSPMLMAEMMPLIQQSNERHKPALEREVLQVLTDYLAERNGKPQS